MILTIPPLVQGIFILTLYQADVIGDQSDELTQNAWFRCALCAAISGEISILIQTRAESWEGNCHESMLPFLLQILRYAETAFVYLLPF